MQHIGDLIPDPRNARAHTPRNVGAIEAALREVGAARSIVVDEHGIILAGNATVEAAAAAGIEKLRVIDADGETIIAVRRSGLTDEQKRRLALFDNRSAELAEWDTDALAQMVGEGVDLRGLWSDEELAAVIEREAIDDGGGTIPIMRETWAIVVICRDESQQVELLQQFMAEGLECRAVIG